MSMAVLEDRMAVTRKQRQRFSGGHIAPEHSQRRTSSLPPDLQKPKRRGSLFGNKETNVTTVTNVTNVTNDYGREEAQPQPRRRRSLFGNMSGDSHARKPRRGSFFGSSEGQQRRDSGSKRRSRKKKSSSLPPDLQKPKTKRRGSLFGNKETNETNVTNDYGYEEAQPEPRRRRSLFGNMSGDSHARKPRRGSLFGSSGGQQRRDSGSKRRSRKKKSSSLPPDLQKTKRRGSLFGNKETNETNDYGYEEAQPEPRRRRSLFGNMSGDSHARKPRRGSLFGSSGGQQRRDSGSKRRSRNKKSNQEGELANHVLAAFRDFED